MKIGIVGLPNAGKSTVFNALAHARVEVKKHPFTTIEPNVGMAAIPDKRLEVLKGFFQPEKVVPAMVRFVDVAGLVEGAGRGQGLGNQFLASLRETDALAHVVACFHSADVPHVLGGIDPARDIEVIRQELVLADLQVCERAREKLRKGRRELTREEEEKVKSLETVMEILAQGKNVKGTEAGEKIAAAQPELNLLSSKPVIYVGNIGEEDLGRETAAMAAVRKLARKEGAETVFLCARLEEEVINLPEEERLLYRREMGIVESGLGVLAGAAFRLLDMVTFFTKEGVEVRAWSVKRSTTASAAAGQIHTDIERGFIKAEVISFPELEEAGSLAAARSRGSLRFEGRDYMVEEGDVIRFHFH